MKKISAVLVCVLLAACSWRSPNSSFYVMNSDDLSAISDKKVSVSVARVKVPDMLNKPQMVISDKNSSQVQVLEFERWGEIYPDILQSTITNDLIAYLPNAYVKRSYFDGEDTLYSVNVEINRLQAYKGDKVELSAWWNIKDSKGRIVSKKQDTYEAKVGGSDVQDLVDAQALAVHKLSRDIALDLAK